MKNSWLGTDSFLLLREFFLEKTSVTELSELPSGTFAEAVVTPIIIFFRKQIVTGDHAIKISDYNKSMFEYRNYTITYNDIKKQNRYLFHLIRK